MSETINFRTEANFGGLPVIVFNRHKIDEFGGYLNWHKEIEMIYLKTGSCRTYIDGIVYTLNPGDIAVASSNMLHHRLWFYGDCYFSVIQIKPDYFIGKDGISNSVIEDICSQRKAFDILIRDAEAGELFSAVLEEWEAREGAPSGGIRLIARTGLLYAYLIDHYCHDRQDCDSMLTVKDRYVRDAIIYINSHISEPISLSDIADELHISPSYLSHVFSSNSGVTISEYMNQIRVQNAIALIKKGASVTDAAFASGFASTSYFSKTFKRLRNIPPSKL